MAEVTDPGRAMEGEPHGGAGSGPRTGHVIVCGLETVAIRTVEQLHLAGARVVVIDEAPGDQHAHVLRDWGIPVVVRGLNLRDALTQAGIAQAESVVVIESTDLRTLETVLLVRDLRPEVKVVAHLDNPAVAHAVQEISGAATVLDVASLFAPAVVETCLKRLAHDIEICSTQFVTTETVVSREATLRELYGQLVPLGVAGEGDQEPIVCPGRDLPVKAGDRVTLFGTRAEVRERGLGARSTGTDEVRRAGRRALRRAQTFAARLSAAAGRPLKVALALMFLLLLASTLILHFGYQLGRGGHLSVIDALYFTVETVATVGFGDFSFATQSTPIEVFGIALIVAGTTLVTTLFALLTNALVRRRIEQSLGHGQIPGMRGHIVVVGLGDVGMEVLDGVLARGRQVVVVERDETNRYLSQVRQRGVPMVLGDAALAQTLDAVNLPRAASVAILTSDDMTNFETGLAVRERLGERWGQVPVVLRVFDRELGRRLGDSFAFRHVWSTVAIAAPWFVGSALGLEVLFSFYVGSHPFLIAKLTVHAGGGLEGVTMRELSARIRVIAINRAGGGGLEHPPRRGTRLAAGDDAYLAGPYEELLEVLKRERQHA